MSFLFSKNTDALKYAEETKTYGIFFEEKISSCSDVHLHNCLEAVLCLTGHGICLSDNKIYTVQSGDMFIFNQFEPHSLKCESPESFARFGAFFHPDYIKARSTDLSDLSSCFYDGKSNKVTLSDTEIAKLESLFIVFRKDMGFGDDIAKNSAIDYFLILINRYFEQFSVKSYKSPVSDVLDFICENFSDDLSLESIASNFSCSVNHVCKLFKEELGVTSAKYISSKRVAEAKKCLTNGKSVSDTAQMCGFSDYANFIRVFKKVTGVSPGKFSRL